MTITRTSWCWLGLLLGGGCALLLNAVGTLTGL